MQRCGWPASSSPAGGAQLVTHAVVVAIEVSLKVGHAALGEGNTAVRGLAGNRARDDFCSGRGTGTHECFISLSSAVQKPARAACFDAPFYAVSMFKLVCAR